MREVMTIDPKWHIWNLHQHSLNLVISKLSIRGRNKNVLNHYIIREHDVWACDKKIIW